MRFEVPQFIDVEDKIFGPFTGKQFIYLAGGAGACVMLYLVLPFWLFLILGTPIAALAAGLAYVPVNSRPLVFFLEAMVKYASSARLYIWKRSERAPNPAAQAAGLGGTFAPSAQNTIAHRARALELNALAKGDGLDGPISA